MKTKTKQLIVLAVIAIWILILMAGCKTIAPAKRTAKYQEPREYAYWRKHNKSPKKDWRIGVAKNQIKAYNIKLKQQEKEERILEKVAELKSQIK